MTDTTDTTDTADTIDTIDVANTAGGTADPIEDGKSLDAPTEGGESLDEPTAGGTLVPTKKTRKVPVRRDESELKELVNKYIKSGLTITEYCRKNKEAAGTLVKNLEDDGYRMIQNGSTAGGTLDPNSELESKIKQLEDELLEITLKHERAELLEAMRSRRNSV